MDAFIGTILPVAFNYAPRGWAFCNGQLLQIAQYNALFALLGVMYGGDGKQTFGLPDLRGRVPVGSQGQGPGLQNVAQGQMGGVNTETVVSAGTAAVTLTTANLPPHSHPISATTSGLSATSTLNATTNGPGSAMPAAGSMLCNSGSGGTSGAIFYTGPTTPSVALNAASVTTSVSGNVAVTCGNTGQGATLSAPVSTSANISVMQPFTGMNYIICLEGIYPSRN
jgi:microcystin-dependent protein